MTFPRLNPDAEDEHGEPCPIMVGYGYGLGITKNCHGMTRVAHSGGLPGYGSQYRFFPEYGLGIISFANRTYAGTGGVNGQVELLLRREGRLKGRSLPASPILQERADQVQAFLQSWDASQGEGFLAENFFLDQSLEHRRREMEQLLAEAGTIESAGPLQPVNNLRGQFTLHGSQKDIQVFFTLSPEQIPKVQAIYTWLTDLED